MIKIFKGTKCNTRTAKFIHSYQHGASQSEPDWFIEELFLNESGHYFLYVIGNRLSIYAERGGLEGELRPGEDIKLLSEREAREWASEHMNDDEYRRAFIAEEPQIRIYATLSETAASLLARERERTGSTLSELLENLIREHLSGGR